MKRYTKIEQDGETKFFEKEGGFFDKPTKKQGRGREITWETKTYGKKISKKAFETVAGGRKNIDTVGKMKITSIFID